MQTLHINGTDMAYLDVGQDTNQGPPLVCVHGSLCDFRIWSVVLGPLARTHRVIAPSLRHFFPAYWDGVGDTYSIAQHVDDMIGFIERLGSGPVDLMGHSRGGHIAFRLAGRRPDLLRKLILAEPGGELDGSLDPEVTSGPSPLAARFAAAAARRRTPKPSAPRRCSSAAPTPGADCPRCCARWPRMSPDPRSR
jgi:pimeloyl-ACP methyl ester carboxylesterase